MTLNHSEIESAGLRILEHICEYDQNLKAGEKTGDQVSRIVTACRELEALVTPSQVWNLQIATAHHRASVMCMLLDWKIPQILSEASGAMSLGELSKASGVAEPLLRGIMRESAFNFIFDEPQSDVYRLNRHSRTMLNPGFAAILHYQYVFWKGWKRGDIRNSTDIMDSSDVNLRPGAHLPEYVLNIKGMPIDSSPTTAFQMAFNTERSFYEFHEQVDRVRGARFDAYMETLTALTDKPIELFFPFHKLNPGSLVVDVGGGKGHNSIRLARQEPHLSFIVQDYEGKRPSVADENSEAIPQQVQWQQHDYLLEQPVKRADVYLLSNVIMDCDSRKARRIIKQITDAMEPNVSVLLIDDLMDPGPAAQYSSHANCMNFHMLACFGTLIKGKQEWEELLSWSKLEIVDRRSDGWKVSFRLIKAT